MRKKGGKTLRERLFDRLKEVYPEPRTSFQLTDELGLPSEPSVRCQLHHLRVTEGRADLVGPRTYRCKKEYAGVRPLLPEQPDFWPTQEERGNEVMPTKEQGKSNIDRIAEVLQAAAGKPLHVLEIARLSGVSLSSVSGPLTRLHDDGKIKWCRKGLYVWKMDTPEPVINVIKSEAPRKGEQSDASPTQPGSRAVAAFHFEGHDVRIVNRDGTPWERGSGLKPHWVLVDACRAVGIGNAPMVASRLDDDEKYAINIADGMGRLQQTTIVTRPGLTKVLRESRKPEAKAAADRFDRWVRHDVLEQVYETGAYVHPGVSPPIDAAALAAAVATAVGAALTPVLERQTAVITKVLDRFVDAPPTQPEQPDDKVVPLTPDLFEGDIHGVLKAHPSKVFKQTTAARTLADAMGVSGGAGGFTADKLGKLLQAWGIVTGGYVKHYYENDHVIIPHYAPQCRDWFRMTPHVVNGRIKWAWALTALAMEELEKRIDDIKKWFDAC